MSKGDSTESSNPFAEIEEEDEDGADEANGDDAESLDVAIPEWLAELPDDLEVKKDDSFCHFKLLLLIKKLSSFFSVVGNLLVFKKVQLKNGIDLSLLHFLHFYQNPSIFFLFYSQVNPIKEILSLKDQTSRKFLDGALLQ